MKEIVNKIIIYDEEDMLELQSMTEEEVIDTLRKIQELFEKPEESEDKIYTPLQYNNMKRRIAINIAIDWILRRHN